MIYVKLSTDNVCGWAAGRYFFGRAGTVDLHEQACSLPRDFANRDGVRTISEEHGYDPEGVFRALLVALNDGGIEKARNMLDRSESGWVFSQKEEVPIGALLATITPVPTWAF